MLRVQFQLVRIGRPEKELQIQGDCYIMNGNSKIMRIKDIHESYDLHRDRKEIEKDILRDNKKLAMGIIEDNQ